MDTVGDELHDGITARGGRQRRRDGATLAVMHRRHSVEQVGNQRGPGGLSGDDVDEPGDRGRVGCGVPDGREDVECREHRDEVRGAGQLGSEGDLLDRAGGSGIGRCQGEPLDQRWVGVDEQRWIVSATAFVGEEWAFKVNAEQGAIRHERSQKRHLVGQALRRRTDQAGDDTGHPEPSEVGRRFS